MNPDPTPIPEQVREALERVARGEADLDVLAAVLARTSGMIAVIPTGPGARQTGWMDARELAPAGLPGPDGRVVPRGFTSHGAAASWARAHGVTGEDGTLLTQATPWARALRGCVDREDTGLVIDDGTAHAIVLGRGDLQQLLAVFEALPRPAPRTLLARAREGAALPPVPAPRRTDDASRAFLAALEPRFGTGMATWLFVETLMYEMDAHLQVDPKVYNGLRWPSFHQGPGDGQPTTVFAFAGGDTLRQALAERPESGTEGVALAAVEALRWIVAAPGYIEMLTFLGRLQDTGQARPVDLYLPALLPAAHHIGDLREVPAVALPRLGALPGGRALRPEAVRALVLGWRHLIGVKDGRTVQLDGQAWMPVASSEDAFFAALPRGARGGEPDPAGAEPPFLRWLMGLGGAAGLVLDPGGESPLKIESVDLLLLDRWSAHPERQPGAHEALTTVAKLLEDGAITPERAGRMAADFPFYWIGARAREAQREVLMFPDTDALLLFTSEESARRYLGELATLGLGEGFAPARVRFGWAKNPFVMALAGYSEAWIDPASPMTGGGLRLSSTALKAAVARLDETLKPRVPGFIVA
jgi:hypothetical protein